MHDMKQWAIEVRAHLPKSQQNAMQELIRTLARVALDYARSMDKEAAAIAYSDNWFDGTSNLNLVIREDKPNPRALNFILVSG